MTSEAGRDMHPEVAEIADLSEGLLPVDRATQVRLHLADCELCTDVLASLEEIRGLLGTLPAPQRMPDDIAERIDAALAAEALLDSARPDVPRGTSTTTDSGNVPRGTSVSAPSGHAGSSTGPGRSGGSGIRPGGRRSRRLLLVAGSVASALVLGGAVYEVTANQSSDKNESSAMQRPGADASSGATSVAGQVKRLLTGQATSAGPDTGTTMAPNHADTPVVAATDCSAWWPASTLQTASFVRWPTSTARAGRRTGRRRSRGCRDGYPGAPRLASMSPGSTSSGCTWRSASALRA